MKPLCKKCSKLAVWMYAPSSSNTNELDRFYCDDHIKRGCSCNINPNTGEEDKDEQGRLYPCCEYLYDDNGFYLD